MTFRARVTVLIALSVTFGLLFASFFAYAVTRHELTSQIDHSLRDQLAVLLQAQPPANATRPPSSGTVPPQRSPFNNNLIFMQIITSTGSVERPDSQRTELPRTDVDLAKSNGGKAIVRNVKVDGTPVRMVTQQRQNGDVIQIGRSLSENQRALRELTVRLAGVTAIGVLLAGIFAFLVARRSVRPIMQLIGAAEYVATTQDLTKPIKARGRHELARLGGAFNHMIAEVRQSQEQQQRLIIDASHELRTPLAVIRSNVELLQRPELPEEMRQRITTSIVEEVEEFDGVVNEIVMLAQGRDFPVSDAAVKLDEVVERCAGKLRRRAPGLIVSVRTESTLVRGDVALIERAIDNLLDNARKWSPEDGIVEVDCSSAEFSVQDHGPGISDEDLPYVTERFYRSDDARSKPGSGLGLAIVQQIAVLHGATFSIVRAPAGGTLAKLVFVAAL